MSSWSISSHLLASQKSLFENATHSPFLVAAVEGTLPKSLISHWLANDRLYMQGYMRLAGELLRIVHLPAKPTGSKSAGTIETRLIDWLVDALVNIRREERFFMDVAERYNLDVDITGSDGLSISAEKKLEGLLKFEDIFATTIRGHQEQVVLPWLEGVVLFWATEKVYFEAWSLAKRRAQESKKSPDQDADGGAMRTEFIPNWTNDEFISFVDTLQGILDEGVQATAGSSEERKKELVKRAETIWMNVLQAEEAFWPKV